MIHESLGREPSLADFQTFKEALVEMKSNYLHLFSDRYQLLMLVEIYHDALVGKVEEVNRINYKLEIS